MSKLLGSALVCIVVGCGGTSPAAPPAPASAGVPAPSEPKVSSVVRTRLSKDTPCGADDVCGFYLQVVSPGADPAELTEHALKLLRGHCGGTVIVYRDKRGVMGAGSVFATEDEKRACAAALGTTGNIDDYPSSAVWRKAD
jgi:hypothetical protein